MPDLDEFWATLERRGLEPDLRDELKQRTSREQDAVRRLPAAALEAVIARLLPGAVPPAALAAFIDAVYDRQLGRSDEKDGLMPREELLPTGLALLGNGFATLPAAEQDRILRDAAEGKLPAPERFDWETWFRRLRALALLGLGSDPRGMVFMGYPGPSYQSGHLWLDEMEVAARAARHPGHRTL